MDQHQLRGPQADAIGSIFWVDCLAGERREVALAQAVAILAINRMANQSSEFHIRRE